MELIHIKELRLGWWYTRQLEAAGFDTLAKLKAADDEQLMAAPGIGRKRARIIREMIDDRAMRELLEGKQGALAMVRDYQERLPRYEQALLGDISELKALLGMRVDREVTR